MDTNETTVAPTSGGGSTPAPSAPAAVADRPSSFSEAFARADAAAETAAPATPVDPNAPAAPASVDATAPPAAQSDPTVPAPPVETQGPVPFARHKQALENAREEATKAAEKAFNETHRNHLDWAKAIEANPVNALHLVKDALRDPEHGPGMRAELARMFGGLRQQPKETAAAAAPEPEPDLQTADGELVYSAKRLKEWQKWNGDQQAKQIEEKFAPIVQEHETRQLQGKVRQFWKASEADMKALFNDYVDMPGFSSVGTDGKVVVHPEIIKHFKELTELDARGFPKTEPGKALRMAYKRVAKGEHEKAITSAGQKSQQELLAAAAAKSAGRTDNPAAVTAAPPRRPRTWDEAFAQQGLQ